MRRLQIVGQPAGGFGDDLKTSRDRIDGSEIVLERGTVESCREVCGEIDVMEDREARCRPT